MYDGMWSHGKTHGKGKVMFADGRTGEGTWRAGHKTGGLDLSPGGSETRDISPTQKLSITII